MIDSCRKKSPSAPLPSVWRPPKLSAGMLQQAMKKVLDEMQKGVTGHKTKLHHGKQTLRQLMKHNTGVSNIEITDQNIRAFSATAKKYGIDFALKKGHQRRDSPLSGVLQGPGCRRHHGGLPGVLRKEPGEREKSPLSARSWIRRSSRPKPSTASGRRSRPKTGVWNYDGCLEKRLSSSTSRICCSCISLINSARRCALRPALTPLKSSCI